MRDSGAYIKSRIPHRIPDPDAGRIPRRSRTPRAGTLIPAPESSAGFRSPGQIRSRTRTGSWLPNPGRYRVILEPVQNHGSRTGLRISHPHSPSRPRTLMSHRICLGPGSCVRGCLHASPCESTFVRALACDRVSACSWVVCLCEGLCVLERQGECLRVLVCV